MELGSTVCTPRNPSCSKCPINEFCLAFKQVIISDSLIQNLNNWLNRTYLLTFQTDQFKKDVVKSMKRSNSPRKDRADDTEDIEEGDIFVLHFIVLTLY